MTKNVQVKSETNQLVATLGGLYVMGLFGTVIRCYSVFYNPLIQYFESSYAGVSQINAFFFGGFAVANLVNPQVNRLLGFKYTVMVMGFLSAVSIFIGSFADALWLIVVFEGLIPGFCFASILCVFYVISMGYPEKRANLICQIYNCGMGLIPMAICPICNILIDAYGWRGCFQILSGMFLNLLVVGILLRPTHEVVTSTNSELVEESNVVDSRNENQASAVACKKERNETEGSRFARIRNTLHLELLKSTKFWSWTFAYVFYVFSYFAITQYVIPFGVSDIHLDELKASFLISGLSAGDNVSKIFHAILFVRLSKQRRLLFLVITMFSMSVLIAVFSLSTTFLFAIIITTSFGLVAGGLVGSHLKSGFDMFCPSLFVFIYSYCVTLTYLFSMVGQLIVGWVIDQTRETKSAFYIGCVFAFLSGVSYIILALCARKYLNGTVSRSNDSKKL